VAAPCPYLPGREERKLFTELRGGDAVGLNDILTHYGFRRSQNVAYRPACDNCSACRSVRIRVKDFELKRWGRKTLKANSDLIADVIEPWVTDEQFDLLKTYLDARHGDGGMAGMDAYDYTLMVEDTPVDTTLTEYRVSGGNGTAADLVAACLTDRLSDGLSMVYSFYNPTLRARSLGTFMILEHVARARRLGLDYVYLGYMVSNCRKMTYKARFQPLEMLGPDGWQPAQP
jgi:arginine-tRNA-protein transferase